jgi:hypothetical protein
MQYAYPVAGRDYRVLLMQKKGRSGSMTICIEATIPHQSGETEGFEQICVPKGASSHSSVTDNLLHSFIKEGMKE